MSPCCTGRDTAPAVLAPSPSSASRPPSAPKGGSWSRRFIAGVQWALPVTVLALIPKCPACFAGYVLLFTGVGLSLPGASAIRWILVALSIAAIAYFIFRALRRTWMLSRNSAPLSR